ncbi:hypothetical protein IJ182_05535 [bacterium]|nr:hypothetical protein [bacterium]
MDITRNEIEDILSKIDNGEKILSYIEELERHLEHHHHDEDCDCGCHDHEEEEWEEIKTPYKNSLSVKDWEKLLKDNSLFTKDSLIILKRMRHIAAPTSSAELADMFGLGALYYSLECNKLEKRLIPVIKAENLEEKDYWSILFQCWRSKNMYNEQIYALRPELYEALGNIDLSTVPLRENEI